MKPIKLYNSNGERVNHSNLAEFPIPPDDALAIKFDDEVDGGRWVTDESDLARLRREDAPLSYTESGLAMLGVTQTKTQWVTESDLSFDFADLKGEAYDALSLEAETDDSTDDAIYTILDLRGLRTLHGGEYKFDSESSREDYLDAVKTGMQNWAGKL